MAGIAYNLLTSVGAGGTVNWHLTQARFGNPRGFSMRSYRCDVFYNTTFIGSLFSQENIHYGMDTANEFTAAEH